MSFISCHLFHVIGIRRHLLRVITFVVVKYFVPLIDIITFNDH